MKLLCPSCERLVPFGRYRTDGGKLWVTCPRCGVESSSDAEPADAISAGRALVPASAPPVDLQANLFAVPSGRCPKCIAVRPTASTACPSCGLSFENAQPDAYGPEPALAAEWKALLGQWGEARAHERLLSSAALRGELAGLGRLYRLRLAASPDDAVAQHGLDEVVARASVPTAFSAPAEAPMVAGMPRWKFYAVGALALLLCGLGLMLIRQLISAQM
jgi:hypothetical protein